MPHYDGRKGMILQESPAFIANYNPRGKMPSVLCHLILDVRDLDGSLEFYGSLLGLRIERRQEYEGNRLAYLDTGTVEILLLQQPNEDQNPLLERSGGLVINFHVADLPSVAKKLQAHNVRILRPLEMALWGERTLLVADPDGYAVLLSEPVGAG